ncbi:MFS transporter [Amorphus sp. MBR-141]
MSASARLGAAGFALIAVTYGLARFAFGLFLPAIRDDLSMSATVGGVIAGGSFLGYCLAIVLSAWLTERWGPRPVATAAGAVATVGLALIAAAPNAAVLAAAVLLAGSSTGLASPPLAAAVATALPSGLRDSVNTIINAGTSAGLALSGPAALFLGGSWRGCYALFALAAALVTFSIWMSVPARAGGQSFARPHVPAWSADLGRLVAACLLTGAASTAVWTFGGDLASRNLGWSSQQVGSLWVAIGIAGIAGASAGALARQIGLAAATCMALAVLALGTVLVGWPTTTASLVLAGGLLAGVAYVMLTGLFLVWGTRAVPDRPATGVTVAFLAIAVGQTAGAPLFGALLDAAGAAPAVGVFAGLAVAAVPVARHAPAGARTA